MTFHDVARQYLAEVFDGQLADRDGTEYAVLKPCDRERFDRFVDEQADDLARVLYRATEAFMAGEADELPKFSRPAKVKGGLRIINEDGPGTTIVMPS